MKAEVCPLRRKFEHSWLWILFQVEEKRWVRFPAGSVPASELACLCVVLQHTQYYV